MQVTISVVANQMFNLESRIQQSNGLKFYEQDVIMNNIKCINDIQVEFEAEYITPGLGYVLNGIDEHGADVKYILRIGFNECSIILHSHNIQQKLVQNSINLSPYIENLKLILSKKGKTIYLSIAEVGVIIEHKLKYDLNKFYFGIYSNAENIIKSINVFSAIPNKWNIDVRNTDGGYALFKQDSFSIYGGNNNAEIEQSRIELKKGSYILSYKTEKNINETNDLRVFVFPSDSTSPYDEEKNILNEQIITIPFPDFDFKTSYFELKEPTLVTLKIKGKSGTIKEISIGDEFSNGYVQTISEPVFFEGSKVEFDTIDIKEIEWTGTITNLYYEDKQQELLFYPEHSILTTQGESTLLFDAHIFSDLEYSYIFNKEHRRLRIYRNNIMLKEIYYRGISQKISIFNNLSATITKLSLTKNNDEKINLITKHNSNIYVPDSINSPIIVVDEQEQPFDLSSSYRKVGDKYIFTNRSREAFNSNKEIKVSSAISKDFNTIIVYGIHKDATIDETKFYNVPSKELNTIDAFCSQYDTIYEKDLLFLDKEKKELYVHNPEKYKMIIVDYLKEHSYCINHLYKEKVFEINISSNNEKYSLLYDHKEYFSGNTEIEQINSYKPINIDNDTSGFIVLRKDEF